MKLWTLLSCVSIVLAACSQSDVRPRSRLTSGELVTCKQVTPTGSHMPRTVCRSVAQREKDERDGRALLEEEQRRRGVEDAMRDTLRRETGLQRP